MAEPNIKPSSGKRLLLGLGFVYLGIIGLGIGLYLDDMAAVIIGLAVISLGMAVYTVATVRGSYRRMRTIANFVFHEKLAIISSYLGKPQKQIEHDRQAALEMERWVEPILRQEFEELWQEYFENERRPIVVKIGGSTLGNHDTTLKDIVALQKQGALPVVVHGGGTRVTEWLEKMGVSTSFIRGTRVTDKESLQVVVAVLAGLVNKELVAAINSLGGKALGLSGIDGALIEGQIKSPDMGYTGEVVKVNPESIIAVISAGYIPVIATGGFRPPPGGDDPVMLLNINADASASEIALALKAERLIFLTDVPGVQDDKGKLLPKLSAAKARSLIDSSIITGGMIPKVEGCLRARSHVPSTQIIDGRNEGALLAAVKGKGNGTTIE
ncbi:MAG TPA: acetylglutamate kinase [Dehalococcoidia bacterium]|nr:acetylglutamate kinase [Dehalococcoidia bacterium]